MLPVCVHTVANYRSLIIVIIGIWLELSAVTDKQHWLKSHPHLRHDVLNAYLMG